MKLDILGVPERLSNGDGETSTSSTREPISNGAPLPPLSPMTSRADAHAALLRLAIDDSWSALYDPTNEDSITLDGSGNLVELRDSLGNYPPMVRAELHGSQPPLAPLAPMGALRGGAGGMGAALTQETDLYVMSVLKNKDSGPGFLFTGIDLNDAPTRRVTAYLSRINDIATNGSAGAQNTDGSYSDSLGFWDVFTPEPVVWGFDTSTAEMHISGIKPEPDNLNTVPAGRAKSISVGKISGGVVGPIFISESTMDAVAVQRVASALARLSGGPTALGKEDDPYPEAYATVDEAGNLINAYRPDRPVYIASLTKLMVTYMARKYVPDSKLDQEIVVVPPWFDSASVDNRYPDIYPGDTISWRDAFHLSLMRSHNRVTDVIAHAVGLILNPESPTPMADFLAHIQTVARTSYGWKEATFDNPMGRRENTLTARHVVELMRKIKVEDPWLYSVSGVQSWPFTISRAVPINGESVFTGTVENSNGPRMGGDSFPEFVGGKGGLLTGPTLYTQATYWQDPVTGQVMSSVGLNLGLSSDVRYRQMRRIITNARTRYGSPAHWSALGESGASEWWHEAGAGYISTSVLPGASQDTLQVLPFDQFNDPLPIVRAGDVVRFEVKTKNPYTTEPSARLTVAIDLRGGLFTTKQPRVSKGRTATKDAGWPATVVQGTVKKAGVLTPSVFVEGGGANHAVWAKGATLRITTPEKMTYVYSMDSRGFQLTEDAQPLDSSNSGGGVGEFSVDLLRPERASVFSEYGAKYLYGKRVRMTTRFGVVYGTITDVDETDIHLISVSCMSELGALNAYEVNAPPFNGSLLGLLTEYFGIIAESAPEFTVDEEIAGREMIVPGWSGELWFKLKQLCAAENIQVGFRPEGGVHFTATPQNEVTLDDVERYSETGDPGQLAESVDVVKYDLDRVSNVLVYPDGGWSQDTEIITVAPGEYIRYTLELGASVETFTEPKHVEYVARDAMYASEFTIVDEKGASISPRVWKEGGGSVWFTLMADRKSIVMSVKAPSRIMRDNVRDVVTSYSIGSRFGDASVQYSTLRIIGTGISVGSRTLNFATGVDKRLTGTSVGATVDNPFIRTMAQASAAGSRAARSFSGFSPEIKVTTQSPLGGTWGTDTVGSLVKGEDFDFRLTSTTYSPDRVELTAQYHTTHAAHSERLKDGTYKQDEEHQDGLTYAEAQNRGKR